MLLDLSDYLSSLSGIPQTPKNSKGIDGCTLESEDDEDEIQVVEDSFSRSNQKSNSKITQQGQKSASKVSVKKKKAETSKAIEKKKSNFELSNSAINFSDVGGVEQVLVKVSVKYY